MSKQLLLSGLSTSLAMFMGVLAVQEANAYQTVQSTNQAEARDGSGRITVEASVIHVISCNAPGENRGQFYIYQYTKRAGFRAIAPPQWGNPIGGRDFGSFAEAASIACAGPGTTAGGAIRVTEATFGGNCKAPRGNMTAILGAACNGRPACAYTIDYTKIGDPASGCQKDYVAQYQCGGTAKSASVPPEAGFSGVIKLSCP
jgi:hypothetical protein